MSLLYLHIWSWLSRTVASTQAPVGKITRTGCYSWPCDCSTPGKQVKLDRLKMRINLFPGKSVQKGP